jgi:hypothetical protein
LTSNRRTADQLPAAPDALLARTRNHFLRVTALKTGQTAQIVAASERVPLAVERVMR